MKRWLSLGLILTFAIAGTCSAQTFEDRMAEHRLPDREPSSASLQMFRFGKGTVGEKVYVTEKPSFEEHSVSAAPYIESDGKGPVKMRIKRNSRNPIYLDSVMLVAGERKYKPIKATADGKDVTKKLSAKDEDCSCFDELVLEFPPLGNIDVKDVQLEFVASAGHVSKTIPMPGQGSANVIVQSSKYFNYLPGSEKGSMALDGTLSPGAELGKASLVQKVEMALGEGKEEVRMWVRDDGVNLSVALDVASDNTIDDSSDKTVLYVRGRDGMKTFTAGAGGDRFGRMGTAYTRGTESEHRVYEFQIPFSQLPQLDDKGKWEIAFAVTM